MRVTHSLRRNISPSSTRACVPGRSACSPSSVPIWAAPAGSGPPPLSRWICRAPAHGIRVIRAFRRFGTSAARRPRCWDTRASWPPGRGEGVKPWFRRPTLSVVVIIYNMHREAPRTLYSLSAQYQQGISAGDYEVIVVDNGSVPPFPAEQVREQAGRFAYFYIDQARPSPAGAVN